MHVKRDGDIVMLVGSPGSGKTTAMADCLSLEYERGHTLILLDVTGDLLRYLRDLGLPRVSWTRASPRLGGARAWSRVVSFDLDGFATIDAATDAWLEYLTKHHRPGDVAAADEAELVFSQPLPSDNHLRIVKLARNWQLRLYVATQRPQLVASILRSNATHVALFKVNSRAVIEGGTREFGDPELFEPAYRLERFYYLHRPYYREDMDAPLVRYDSREDRAPWLDD